MFYYICHTIIHVIKDGIPAFLLRRSERVRCLYGSTVSTFPGSEIAGFAKQSDPSCYPVSFCPSALGPGLKEFRFEVGHDVDGGHVGFLRYL